MTRLITRPKQATSKILKKVRFRDERLIIVLLIIALSSVFIFGNDRGHFYPITRGDGWISPQSLSIAANLSPEHNFLMFRHQTLDDDGKPTYVPYNRFPIGSYILVKLVILPFWNDFSAQIYAARILTLTLFSATVILAYLSISRIADNRWVALAAVMLAFSSYNMLYHIDMIGEGVVSLFGVMLVSHGMTIFLQEGRFRQLLVKTCVALLLGWHVFAFLLVFIIIGIANELIRNRTNIFSTHTRLNQLKATFSILIRSRYLTLGIVALIFGASLLTFNLTSEYLVLNRETAFTELPSFQSVLKRTGLNPEYIETRAYILNWPNFLWGQLYRIGAMSIPYYWPGYDNAFTRYGFGLHGAIIGSIALTLSLASISLSNHKMLTATLVLSGVLWSVVMRSTTGFHFYETIFFIGIPLTVFATFFNRLSSTRLIAGTAVFALAIFAISAYQMSLIEHDEEAVTFQAETLQDFQSIAEIANDKVIYIDAFEHEITSNWTHFAVTFYLTGNIMLFKHNEARRNLADLVITRENETQLGLLTPQNKRIFLYDRQLYEQQYQAIYDMAQATEPAISSQFDVYLDQNTLFYVKDPCSLEDTRAKFLLHLVPIDINDLPEERQQFGFDNWDFDFDLHGSRYNQKCAAQIKLPEYDIASVNTGQYISGEPEQLWSGSYDIPRYSEYQAIYDMAQAAEPVIRSQFTVHLDQNMLFYIKEQCDATDIEPRFLLHLIPIDVNDLSEERRQSKFDNLDFDFDQHGGMFNRKCAAQIELPEYGIARFRTGQYVSGEGELWSEWYYFPQTQK